MTDQQRKIMYLTVLMDESMICFTNIDLYISENKKQTKQSDFFHATSKWTEYQLVCKVCWIYFKLREIIYHHMKKSTSVQICYL